MNMVQTKQFSKIVTINYSKITKIKPLTRTKHQELNVLASKLGGGANPR